MGRRRLALATFIAMIAGACSGDGGVDRGATINRLVDNGLPRDAAECVVDRTIEAFGESEVLARETPSEEDRALLAEITLACVTPS